jgi:hypothetical protein
LRSPKPPESPSACRTIRYPFVSDNYYVQVTDDTACFGTVPAQLSSRRQPWPASKRSLRTSSSD